MTCRLWTHAQSQWKLKRRKLKRDTNLDTVDRQKCESGITGNVDDNLKK